MMKIILTLLRDNHIFWTKNGKLYTVGNNEKGQLGIGNNDNKNKMWFISENSLVLPEYLVDFDYIIIHK